MKARLKDAFLRDDGVTALIDIECNPEDLNQYKGIELELTLEKFNERKSRSLDSNAYAWQLMTKIAKAIQSDKWSVYLDELKRYSSQFLIVNIPKEGEHLLRAGYRVVEDLGEVIIEGETLNQYQVYIGSSQFDQVHMSEFIHGIVIDAQELGIQTLTEQEIREMNERWCI